MLKPLLKTTAGAFAALCLSTAALAQQDTTRIIVPFAAGGPIDVSARVLAEAVKDDLGTVIIENKPGAGSNIGVDYVAKSKPDGKTIGISTLASQDRKSTRLNSSHVAISYTVFCLKKKNKHK